MIDKLSTAKKRRRLVALSDLHLDMLKAITKHRNMADPSDCLRQMIEIEYVTLKYPLHLRQMMLQEIMGDYYARTR